MKGHGLYMNKTSVCLSLCVCLSLSDPEGERGVFYSLTEDRRDRDTGSIGTDSLP